MFRQIKQPHSYTSYMALMTELVDTEPSSYEEAASQQVWQDAMVEKYSSIMKKDL